MTHALATISPTMLHTGAVILSGSAVALVSLHASFLAFAGGRTALPLRTRTMVPVGAALLLGSWLGWALILAQQRTLVGPISGTPLPLGALPTLAAIALAIVIGSAFLASSAVRTLNAAIPPAWLIAIQVYRTAGVTFIWPFMHAGLLPGAFAWPAGIGDLLTGVSAPFVAWAVAQKRPGAYRWAVAWNWFGLIDLIIAPVTAVLSGAQIMAIYPLALIPIFLGPPLGILTHIYSLRNLAANRGALTAGPAEARFAA